MEEESTENHSILNQSTMMILNPAVGALITENIVKERGECMQRSRGMYPSPSAQTWRLELQPLRVCVWTVGEQVGIVSVRQREIDGVG